VAAVSVGIVKDEPVCDLDYHEDSRCQVDANFVWAEGLGLVEVQGTAEKKPFTSDQLMRMTELSEIAVNRLFRLQTAAVERGLREE